MEKKTSKGKESISFRAVFVLIAAIILFTESIYTLLVSFRKGFLKKQVLSSKTSLGFDFDIVMKP